MKEYIEGNDCEYKLRGLRELVDYPGEERAACGIPQNLYECYMYTQGHLITNSRAILGPILWQSIIHQ